MGPMETLQTWNQLARNDVTQRAAELGVSHLILRLGGSELKMVPKAALPVVKKGASKRAATWVAADDRSSTDDSQRCVSGRVAQTEARTRSGSCVKFTETV